MYRARILVNGNPIPVYYDNEGNNWIEARKGCNFEVKVENKDWRRKLAVISVDGLNVITGENKNPWESRGYVINGNNSIKIPGWKINQEQVREFVFEDKCTGYAAKVGADPKNIGVIGVAIFNEKTVEFFYSSCSSNVDYWQNSIEYGNTCDPYLTEKVKIYNSNISEDLSRKREISDKPQQGFLNFDDEVSVGSGKKIEYKTKKTEFERDSLACILCIYYDTKENLIKKGIIKENNMPEPFPLNGTYCKDI